MIIPNKSGNNTALSSGFETAVISSGARIGGEFYLASMLHVGGELNGIVHSESIVVTGKNGNLKGELKTDRIVVNGCLEDNLEADSLEILTGDVVSGNISIKDLAIGNGDRFNETSKIKQEGSVGLLENNSE